jgi:hypothetical protein
MVFVLKISVNLWEGALFYSMLILKMKYFNDLVLAT